MKITIAALKKIIAEGTFEEGMRHVNENAIADLYSLLRQNGSELSTRLQKAARINDPRLKQVNDQAQDLVAVFHAIMNAKSLQESKARFKKPLDVLSTILQSRSAAAMIVKEQHAKNPNVIRALHVAQSLNETLQQLCSKKNDKPH